MALDDMNMKILLRAQNEASKVILQVQKDINNLQKSSDQATKEMDNAFGGFLPGSILKLGGLLGAGYLGAKMLQAGKSAVTLAGNLEQAKIAFNTMLQSSSKADRLIKELSDFAKRTPFELTGIRQNAKQLLAMGIEANNLMPTLKSLGDVSAGLSVPLERLAINYGQVIAQGKLTGRELRDFTLAGVPLLDELSNMIGKSKSEIQDMISAGKIKSNDVVKAFQNMSSEGGRFFNLMDKQSNTFQGKLSNLQDTLDQLGEKFGTPLLTPLKELVDTFIKGFESIDDSTIKTYSLLFETAISSFQSILEGVGEMTNDIVGSAGDIYTAYNDAFNLIIGDTSDTATASSGSFKDLFMFISLGVQGVASAFRIAFSAIGDIFQNIIDIGVDSALIVINAWKDVGKAIKLALQGDFEGIKGLTSVKSGMNIWNTLKDGFGDTAKAVEEEIGKIEDLYFEFYKNNLPNYLKDAGGATKDYNAQIKSLGGSQDKLGKETKGASKELKEQEKALKELIKQINKRVESEVDGTDKIRDKIHDIVRDIVDLKEEYIDLGREASQAIKDIQDEYDNLQSSNTNSVANRAVEIDKEMKALVEEYRGSNGGITFSDFQEEYAKLEEEKALALKNTTQEAYEASKAYDALNETQKLVFDGNKALQELEAKKLQVQQELQVKVDALKLEEQALKTSLEEQVLDYNTHVDKIRGLFKEHFAKLEVDTRGHVITVMAEYENIVDKLKEIKSLQMDTGTTGLVNSVSGATPSNSNVTINVGGINIPGSTRSSISEEDIQNAVAKGIIDAQRNFTQGIA